MTIIYQLKIELAGSHPTIWRRLNVPGNTPFDHLHDIIQISMGWNDDYPFQFTINDTTVRDFGAEIDMGENPDDRDAMDSVLEELVTMVNTRFTYAYGFDNPWEHQVTLEKILHTEEATEHPVCIGGEGSCPPDDCGDIRHYQSMPDVLADKEHPKDNNIKGQLGEPEDVVSFDIAEINARLSRYSEEWDEIYRETEHQSLEYEHRDIDSDEVEDQYSEYEFLKAFKSPSDLLDDDVEKQEMENWIIEALAEKDSAEHKTFARLVKQGHDEKKSTAMILDAFSIEWFSDLKYGTGHLNDRYERNLNSLPEKPAEINSLDCALQILNRCTKGIPFTAIAYLHDDTSPESSSAIVNALKDFSENQCRWDDCFSTPIWYSLAAEGHLCEELIDPVIGLYRKDNEYASDWIHDQGQYLIGKLAQKYPDLTVQKILAAMESEAENESGSHVYYLFDAFDFCNIDKYKDRLIALLKRGNISWHDLLATTIAHLQIKEGLPVLKEQLRLLKSKTSEKHLRPNWHIIEFEEAIRQLETGEDLYPDVDMPVCLKRTTSWREEFADAEKYFYDSGSPQEDDFNLERSDGFDQDNEPLWGWGFSQQQPIVKENKTGRNDLCPCGSGKKYKKCCLGKDVQKSFGR